MSMWGARPKGREAAVEQQSHALPEDRLGQLMAYVEKAAAPPPVEPVAPVRRAWLEPSVQFPDPILVSPPSEYVGKRRALPQSA